jgi:CDP-diacylglycerol--serine O-phosphatidyltransferase
MSFKKNIPNAITCGNLFCGCLAIVSAFKGDLITSTYLVAIAAVLDFFDGFVARLLHVKSEIGKQLDSLADVVTFGVVPGVIMYFMLLKGLPANMDGAMQTGGDTELFPQCLVYTGFLISIFSALRLAKFNVDERQTTSFIGLPTPANALLISSLPLIENFQPQLFGCDVFQYIHNPWFLLGLTVVSCYLMIAELPLFAFKFTNRSWKDNKIRFIFIFAAIILLILFKFIAVPFIILLYILLSMFANEKID